MLAQAGVAVASHNHEVSRDIRGMRKDRIRNPHVHGADALDLDIKSMSRKMLSDIIDPGRLNIIRWTSYHRKYFDHLGALKQRHRITDGASRGSTSVPTDHNTFKFCVLRMDVRHDNHGPPRFKQCPFDDGYFLGVIGHGLTDHGEIETAGKAAKRVADLPHRHVYHLRLSGDARLLCNCFKASCGFVR